jgi:hypothetical protein
MNTSALIAVALFALAVLSIFGALYRGALKSQAKGEMDIQGIRLLRWALAGHITLFTLLAVTAFLT